MWVPLELQRWYLYQFSYFFLSSFCGAMPLLHSPSPNLGRISVFRSVPSNLSYVSAQVTFFVLFFPSLFVLCCAKRHRFSSFSPFLPASHTMAHYRLYSSCTYTHNEYNKHINSSGLSFKWFSVENAPLSSSQHSIYIICTNKSAPSLEIQRQRVSKRAFAGSSCFDTTNIIYINKNCLGNQLT